MSSIFSLARTVDDLPSSNAGIDETKYIQCVSTRDVTGFARNFSSGPITYKFTCDSAQWWLPSRSYLRLRVRLTKPDQSPLLVGDQIAPNMFSLETLFTSAEMRLNGVTVSRVSDFMPEVSSFVYRQKQTGEWLNSTGDALNNAGASFYKRRNKVAADSVEAELLDFTTEVVAPAENVTVANYQSQVTQLSADTFELISPLSALGIMNYSGALPGGDWSLWLYPVSQQTIGFSFVETQGATTAINAVSIPPQPGVTPTFAIEFVEQYYYAAVVEGKTFEGSYLIDMEQTTLQTQKITSAAYQSKVFQVSPSTFQLAQAFGDQRNLNDTRISNTKFKVYADPVPDPTTGDAGADKQARKDLTIGSLETRLTQAQMSYAGMTKYSPSFRSLGTGVVVPQQLDPATGAPVSGGSQTITQLYLSNLMTSGNYYCDAGESLLDFINRGLIFNYSFPKSSQDSSTVVNVWQEFSGNQETIANMRVLLFSTSRQVARVTIENSLVTDVRLTEG